MSYDFSIELDTGGSEPHYIEPYFDDVHPEIGSEGHAGNVMVTASGYARCGNYTSNVIGMWVECLTNALSSVPADKRDVYESWMGDDDRRFNAEGGTAIWWGKDGVRHDGPLPVDDQSLCLCDLAGKRAGDLVPLLEAAVAWGIAHLAELHEDDPENGWGDADGAVTYLWDIQRSCQAHPNGKLYISS